MLEFSDITDSGEMVDLEAIQEQAIQEQNKGAFINDPGQYSLQIRSVEQHIPKNPVQGWAMVKVTLADTNGKEIREFLTVPLTPNPEYPTKSGKNKLWAYIKLQAFAGAFGMDLRGKKFFDGVKLYFGNGGERMLGLEGSVEVGYEHKNYAQYQSKDKYAVVIGDKVHTDEDGEVVAFADKVGVFHYIENELQKPYSQFVSILKYNKKSTEEVKDSHDPYAG
jgi:hypothetical protein